jgi:hypothetical protein
MTTPTNELVRISPEFILYLAGSDLNLNKMLLLRFIQETGKGKEGRGAA